MGALIAFDQLFGGCDIQAFPLSREKRKCQMSSWLFGEEGVNTLSQLHSALGCQVHGLLAKTCSAQELLDCLRAVSHGNVWLPKMLTTPPTSRRHLTTRERQVVELVLEGSKNLEIADALGIRLGTVEVHLKHIFKKTGACNRLALAVLASQHPGRG